MKKKITYSQFSEGTGLKHSITQAKIIEMPKILSKNWQNTTEILLKYIFYKNKQKFHKVFLAISFILRGISGLLKTL